MKYELIKGLIDILDHIDTLSDSVKPQDLEGFTRYYRGVHAALSARRKYYVIGDNDAILFAPEYQDDPVKTEPVPMLLWCPMCGERHIDEGENATREHRTHACQACGVLWAPAVVATVGVQFLPGCKNMPAAAAVTAESPPVHWVKKS